jgi:hypothetical protein
MLANPILSGLSRAYQGAGAPGEIRTPDPQIRSLVLYPAELRARVAQCTGDVPPQMQAGRQLAVAIGWRLHWQVSQGTASFAAALPRR